MKPCGTPQSFAELKHDHLHCNTDCDPVKNNKQISKFNVLEYPNQIANASTTYTMKLLMYSCVHNIPTCAFVYTKKKSDEITQ